MYWMIEPVMAVAGPCLVKEIVGVPSTIWVDQEAKAEIVPCVQVE